MSTRGKSASRLWPFLVEEFETVFAMTTEVITIHHHELYMDREKNRADSESSSSSTLLSVRKTMHCTKSRKRTRTAIQERRMSR